MNQSRKDLLAVAFLALLVTAFFAEEIFTDQTLVTFRLTNAFPWLAQSTRQDHDQPSLTSDCTFSYYPRRVFATRMIREGEIPFWNPHQFCGTPFLATFQTMVFYPVNILLYGVDPATQMDLFLYIHFLIAAIFTYLFARKLKLSSRASVISAITYTFCGFMVTRYGQPTFISTASWLPAVLYFGEHLIESPGFRTAGLLALALSFCILAGFPQLVLLIIYTLGAYVFLRAVVLSRRPAHYRITVVLLLLLAVCVASLVCAFQLLPTYELSRFSYRKVLPYEMVLSSAHHRLVSLKYFIPDILGHPLGIGVLSKNLEKVQGEPAFTQNYVSTTGYVGILPLLLGVLALSAARRRQLVFAVLATVALFVVFGSGVLHVLYSSLPGFNFSRIDRIIVTYMICMSALAGYGFEIAQRDGDGKRRVCVGLAFLIFVVGLGAWLFSSGFDLIHKEAGETVAKQEYLSFVSPKVYWFMFLGILSSLLLLVGRWRRLSRDVIFAGAIGILLLDLIPNGLGFKVSQPARGILPESVLVDSLKMDHSTWRFAKFKGDVIPANTATIIGFDDVHGYDALNIDHYMEVLGVVDSTVIGVSNAALRRRIGPIAQAGALDSKVLDLLNVKYVLTLGERKGRWREPIAVLNDDHLPRAFLVTRARYFASYEQMLAYMKTDDFDPGEEVLLLGKSEPSSPAETEASGGCVEVQAIEPNRLAYRAETQDECYLVFSEVYYPGWRVFVDDTERELLRADYAFRAVKLGPGTHTVRMTYTPIYFRVGLLLSIAGSGLVAVLITSRRRLASGHEA